MVVSFIKNIRKAKQTKNAEQNTAHEPSSNKNQTSHSGTSIPQPSDPSPAANLSADRANDSFDYQLCRYGVEPNNNGGNSLGTRTALDVLHNVIVDDPENESAYLKAMSIYESLNRHSDALALCKIAMSNVKMSGRLLIKALSLHLQNAQYGAANNLASDHPKLLAAELENNDSKKLLVRSFVKSGGLKNVSRGFLKDFFLVPHISSYLAHIRLAAEVIEDEHYIDLLHIARDHVENSGGTFIIANLGHLRSVRNKSDFELLILDAHKKAANQEINWRDWMIACPDHLREIYREIPHFSDEYWEEIFLGSGNTIRNARVVLKPLHGQYSNVRNGRRIVPQAPENADHHIYFFGASDIYGTGVEDAHTIPAQLQTVLNKHDRPRSYRVENFGVRGTSTTDVISNICATTINPGDVVVFSIWHPIERAEQDHFNYVELDFSRPHDHGEIYFDQEHFNWRGTAVVANELADALASMGAFERQINADPGCKVPLNDEALGALEFNKYLLYHNTASRVECSNIEQYREYLNEVIHPTEGVVGSVAVNCNPITRGHLHLLEYAASCVDFLYVFVIEEDQSAFSFEDRFHLVQAATAHITNLKVIKGGRFICTELTYPEYYTKESDNNAKADAAEEASYFCEYIAPPLNITRIFLGNEPTCMITKQYNEQMAEILPSYGIELTIIERINAGDGQPISASAVRRFLANKDFDKIKPIVPNAVYEFLLEKYN